ncbi:hypothetical protein AVEN_47700-1 [Araneus ventricosus]|uniref:Uncharacterized protein n=1 Tax=Araneus ventricosus TaxID=182803 RepID=A0A4Y2L0U3_ARAVE|nr:hypothetical protein AVEN_47700-1 [Araneus ventricosus]
MPQCGGIPSRSPGFTHASRGVKEDTNASFMSVQLCSLNISEQPHYSPRSTYTRQGCFVLGAPFGTYECKGFTVIYSWQLMFRPHFAAAPPSLPL